MSWFRLDHKDLVTVVHSQPGPCSHCSQYLCLGALIPILVLFSTSHGFSLISPFLQSLSRITRCSRFGSQAMPAQNMHLGHGHPYFFFTSLFLKLCPLKFGFTFNSTHFQFIWKFQNFQRISITWIPLEHLQLGAKPPIYLQNCYVISKIQIATIQSSQKSEIISKDKLSKSHISHIKF